MHVVLSGSFLIASLASLSPAVPAAPATAPCDAATLANFQTGVGEILTRNSFTVSSDIVTGRTPIPVRETRCEPGEARSACRERVLADARQDSPTGQLTAETYVAVEGGVRCSYVRNGVPVARFFDNKAGCYDFLLSALEQPGATGGHLDFWQQQWGVRVARIGGEHGSRTAPTAARPGVRLLWNPPHSAEADAFSLHLQALQADIDSQGLFLTSIRPANNRSYFWVELGCSQVDAKPVEVSQR